MQFYMNIYKSTKYSWYRNFHPHLYMYDSFDIAHFDNDLSLQVNSWYLEYQ